MGTTGKRSLTAGAADQPPLGVAQFRQQGVSRVSVLLLCGLQTLGHVVLFGLGAYNYIHPRPPL
jgi:hypothetical protein